jgi:hypothetical protein
MMKNNRSRLLLIIILAVVVATHLISYRNWLFSFETLTHGDWFASTSSGSKELFSLPRIWKAHFNGIIDVTPTFYLFQFIEGALAKIGLNYGAIQRITFLWPIAILTPIFSFLLFKKLTKDNLAALAGAVLYSYNTYFLIIQTGHLTLMTSFTFAPFAVLIFMNYYQSRSLLNLLKAGLVFTVISFYEIRGLYLLMIVLFAYHLTHFQQYWKLNLKSISSSLVVFLAPLLIVFCFHLYWILPFLKIEYTSVDHVFNRALFGKAFFSIDKSIALFHPFWTGKEYHPFIVQPIGYSFYLVPIIFTYGLIILKKNSTCVFFALISIIGVFLAKQDNPPFTPIYELLYSYLPGFGAFREASKFYFITALGYSGIIALTVAAVRQLNYRGYAILTIIVITASLLNLKPLATTEIATMFKLRTIPTAYKELNEFIDIQRESFKTLWIPIDSRWSTSSSTHPRISAIYIASNQWSNLENSAPESNKDQNLITLISSSEFKQALDANGIKYVIVPLQDTVNDDDFFKNYSFRRSDYIQALDNNPNLFPVKLKSPGINIYENRDYLPKIYQSRTRTPLEEITRIEFKTVNTTKYAITTLVEDDTTLIHFTDNFHPSWKLHIGKFNWLESITVENYWYPDKYHKPSKHGNNIWMIDPQWIKQRGYQTGDTVRITLYFAPQSWTNIGLIISIMSLISIFILFIISLFKEHAKNNK